MSIVDYLVSHLAPHDCLGCGAEGRLLCADCATKLRPALACCYRCRTASVDFLTCKDCRNSSALRQVRAVTVYEKLAKDLVWKLKFAHAHSAAREIAAVMDPLVNHQKQHDLLIVPVPTATTRTRQRGYDQARLLARELALSARRPYADVLARQNQAHQVGASRQQRLQQLAAAFRITKPQQVKNAAVLLIDDVVTTGATLEAAAAVLKTAGARHIEALVFAQPEF
jgi:ComF family protein